MDTQNSGQELKAWRERLGKDAAWIEEILNNTRAGKWPVGHSNGDFRRRVCEGVVGHLECPYADDEVSTYYGAYRAALGAEEARQAAARGPAEPVRPEGVTVERMGALAVVVGGGTRVSVAPDGAYMFANGLPATAVVLRYAADLSEYRAAIHAAGDRQRKLDAVEKAREANNAARAEWEAADKKWRAAAVALDNARRKAGL